MTNKAIALLKSTIKNDDVFDDRTGHIFREVNGDIVEYKFCHYCQEWHPVADFGKNQHTTDGLQCYCRKGFSQYERGRKSRKVQPIIEDDIQDLLVEPENVPVKGESNLDALEALLTSLKEEREQKELMIAKLQAEKDDLVKQSKNLDALNECDIKRVLANNVIPIRILFEAIAIRTGRYQFYAIDTETGLKSPIKVEESTTPAYFRSA
ncbi:MAG: hypothetical protein J5965_19380 [Aeriscardovia sp.]|nr:hypothetical protein [Aeriscardovia sp.]